MTDVRSKILIIEDEPTMQKFLRTCLSAEGYRLVETTHGKEGIDLARTHNPDAILLDLGLPDVDGMEVTRSVRKWSERPIIVISARSTPDDRDAATRSGATDFLAKPFPLANLLSSLDSALSGASS